MVEQITKNYKQTIRKIENAYAVLAFLCGIAAVAKLALQPKVHSAWGTIPIWQIIAGILGAGMIYSLYHLMEGETNAR